MLSDVVLTPILNLEKWCKSFYLDMETQLGENKKCFHFVACKALKLCPGALSYAILLLQLQRRNASLRVIFARLSTTKNVLDVNRIYRRTILN